MEHQQRCFYIFDMVDRAIALVGIPVFPWSTKKPSLRSFKDGHISSSRIPVDQVIHGNHVGQGCASRCGFEAVGLGDQEGSLVTSPAVSVQTHFIGIDHACLQGSIYCREHRPYRRHARIIHFVDDIWD